jgi:hypothetical protein
MQMDNLIKDAGWIALAFHFGALFMHIFVFGSWAKSAVKNAPDDPSDGQPKDAEANPIPPVAARPPDESAIDDAIAEMKSTQNPAENAEFDNQGEVAET